MTQIQKPTAEAAEHMGLLLEKWRLVKDGLIACSLTTLMKVMRVVKGYGVPKGS